MAITPNDQTVYANLRVLSELDREEKVTINHQTGSISKDVPYPGDTIYRWWNAAFNTDIIRQTFSRAFDLIVIENEEEPHVKTFGKLSELIPSGLEGVLKLRATYTAKKNEKFTYELARIQNEFEQKMKELHESRQKQETIVELDEEESVPLSMPLEEASADYGKTVTVDVRPLIETRETAKKVSLLKRIFCCVSVSKAD